MADMRNMFHSTTHVRQSLMALAVLLASAATGCSHNAKVMLRGSEVVQGEVVRNDSGTIYVLQADGSETPVAKDNVSDIDHPGDGAAIAGGVLIGVGGLLIIPGAILMVENSNDTESPVPITGAAGLGVLGLAAGLIAGGIPTLVWGLGAESDSIDNAGDGVVAVTPAANVDPITGSWQAGAQVSF